jgi:hypothetical protein
MTEATLLVTGMGIEPPINPMQPTAPRAGARFAVADLYR